MTSTASLGAPFSRKSPVLPQPDLSTSSATASSAAGKMRTRLGEPLHHPKAAAAATGDVPNIVPAFLAAHNTPLPLKALPDFDFVKKPGKACAAAAVSTVSSLTLSRATTATTLPLSPAQTVIEHDDNTSFQFSDPSPAMCRINADDVVTNGVVFSFCQPKEVTVTGSLSQDAPSSPANSSSIRSSKADISTTHKNHASLPDLTATMRSPVVQRSMAAIPTAKSLKSGSVMDMLKQRKFRFSPTQMT